MPESWYEIVAGSELQQGDLLLGIPVAKVDTAEFPLPDEVPVWAGELDLLVITQSCDLENDKVDEVLLALVRSYDEMFQEEGDAGDRNWVRTSKFRKAAVRGELPAYSLLPQRMEDPPNLAWSLVDFHHLYSLPKSYVTAFVNSAGPRLRVVPPYREHLAQAFARYMMRVGLPLLLTDFEKYAGPG